MLAESHDEEQIIARVAALDIGEAELVCCVRLPAQCGPKRLQEVSTHSTMTRSLTELASRLVELGVQRVVMEATSDYWKPVFYLLEAHGLDPWLVNARDVKHLPGRPKSDVIDAVWLCKLAVGWSHRKQRRPQWSQAAGSAALVLLETHRRELEVDAGCAMVLIAMLDSSDRHGPGGGNEVVKDFHHRGRGLDVREMPDTGDTSSRLPATAS